MLKSTELKVALPADFLGKSSDVPQWIKAMKAYFALNSVLYTSNNNKIMTMLNKMSEGYGASFAKMWYDKMADTTTSNTQKTFKRFSNNFETTFYPFDIKATTCLDLFKLVQKTIHLLNGTINEGFQKYITNFQNLASNATITDDIILIDQFSLCVDQGITTMINNWIEKAKTFHA